DAWHAKFGDEVERPRWAELLRSRVAIFDLDNDAILAAMYALSVRAEGDYYLCVLPDPGIEAAALSASESALPGTALAEALHTFTLDSGASRCFFCDSTTLTPLSAPVPVRLADPSGGPVLAHSCIVLLCPADPSGSLSGLHLPLFSTNLVSASGPAAPPCSCRLLSHQTLLWHHRLGNPSLPHLRGMHSRLLVSGLPRSLPPLPPCLPCVEGRQHAAPHSSSFPPTTAPVQTLQMDVWGPARVIGQGHERYILLVVDDYTHYTTVFPLRNKGEVLDVLIPWIRAVRLQLRERFRQDLPVLRLHSDKGGEFSSYLLRDICRGEGIFHSTSGPVSPCRRPRLHCVGRGRLAMRSHAFVCDTFTDKLSARAIPCVFFGFPPDVPGWQFYHPTSCHVLPSQDVTFDESVPFYRLFPYRSAPLPPPPLFLAPGPPPVDPLPPQGPAPSGVSQVDPLPGIVPVEVAVDSGAATGPASGGAEPAGAGPRGAESEGAGSGGDEPGGAEPRGAEPEGAEPGGAESEGAESWGAGPRGTACSGGPAGASPKRSPWPEPLSPQQVREWFAWRTLLRSGAAEDGDSATGGTGARAAGGTRAAGSRGARTGGTGAAGAGGAAGVGAGGAVGVGARGIGTGAAGGTGAARAGGAANVGVGDTGAGGAGPGVVELLDFAAACRLDYAASLVAESESECPPSVGGECALGTDVLEDRQEDFECFAATVPHLVSMLIAPEGDPDAPDIPTPRSYAEAIMGTYVDAVPPLGANIVDGMWIFRVKRPPGSPPAFKARYVARGFSPRQGVEFFKTFSPSPKMTTLRVLLHVAAQHDYELHSLDFSTAFLQGSLHEGIWLRRPPGFTGSWVCSSFADPSLFLRTDTSLPPFYVLVYVDDLVFATADTEALALVKSELQKRDTCSDLGPSALRLPVLLTTVHSSAYRSLSLSSTFVRVLLYVDNKAMIALCQEHRLEHITLRYFLARELQQRGQLRLAYVATRAKTADIFTKALQSGDHQRFCTVLGLVPTLPHLLTA
ncbi:unnamed protein product, partial [Closterium sp. NIES-53]